MIYDLANKKLMQNGSKQAPFIDAEVTYLVYPSHEYSIFLFTYIQNGLKIPFSITKKDNIEI